MPSKMLLEPLSCRLRRWPWTGRGVKHRGQERAREKTWKRGDRAEPRNSNPKILSLPCSKTRAPVMSPAQQWAPLKGEAHGGRKLVSGPCHCKHHLARGGCTANVTGFAHQYLHAYVGVCTNAYAYRYTCGHVLHMAN